jgi:cell division protease FtsH
MAGADLANLVNESAVLAARRNKTLVDMADFEDAKDKVMLGLERRSLVLSEEDRKLTAYHEAGHTVVSLHTHGADPIHKVTIVPRGRALGLMLSLPENDRFNNTREWLIGRLAISYGGRVAEEIIFGPEMVTTGAGSDIQYATNIARKMVASFGMSARVGLMAVGDQQQEIFLGREFAQRREISEHTAQMVDEEVKRLLDEAYARARVVLEGQRDLLERIAQALLERETIDAEDVGLLRDGKLLPPKADPPNYTLPATPSPVASPRPAPGIGPILGAPPVKPAGA